MTIRHASTEAVLEVCLEFESCDDPGYACHWCRRLDATILITVSDWDRIIWYNNRRFDLCDDCAVQLTASLGVHLPDVWSI